MSKDTMVLNFAGVKIPAPIESTEKTNEKYVTCGVDNQFPYFLLQLFQNSSTHASIISTKVDYILGDGLKFTDGSDIKGRANAEDSFAELISKIVSDYEIFNRFAIEVVYNAALQPIEYHFVPVWKVRMNKDKTKFWVNDNWRLSNKAIVLDRWTPTPKDATTKLFYFDGYVPSESTVYALPEYISSTTPILVDSLIDKFTLNTIDSHFSVSSLISFFTGSGITEETKRQINADLTSAYTGATGKKIMVNYQAADSKKPSVENIASNDWADAFAATGARVKDSIILGHRIPYMLVGAPVAGKLGGGNEKDGDMFRFKNNYVRNRRNQLISAFTQLFSGNEAIQGQLQFADVSITEEPSDDLKQKIYTLNEIRKEKGLPALQGGDVLISQYTVASTAPVQPQSKFNSEGFNLSEEDFDKIKDMGILADELEFISEGEFVKTQMDFNKVQLAFETMDEVAKYILDNEIDSTNVKELKTSIRKDLGINVTASELKGMLADITKAGLANIEIDVDGNIKVSQPEQPSRKIQVMYSYDVRPGYGQPIEANTRAFCKKLIENNRFYTPEEIQTMTSIFGYDIFSYGGGWYFNKETGKLESHCRHYFKAVTVTRKRR